MSRKTTIITTGIGAAVMAIITAFVGYQMAEPAMSMGATPTTGGITALVMSLLGASGLSVTSLVAWLTQGRVSKSTPELLASLLAWLGDKSDRGLERRFALAALSTLGELFADNATAQKLIAELGQALVATWLPSVKGEVTK